MEISIWFAPVRQFWRNTVTDVEPASICYCIIIGILNWKTNCDILKIILSYDIKNLNK